MCSDQKTDIRFNAECHEQKSQQNSHKARMLTCMSKNTVKVNNMKAYLLTALFNSVTTIDPYYQNWVLSDNPQFAKP